jgi:hypothetical protein
MSAQEIFDGIKINHDKHRTLPVDRGIKNPLGMKNPFWTPPPVQEATQSIPTQEAKGSLAPSSEHPNILDLQQIGHFGQPITSEAEEPTEEGNFVEPEIPDLWLPPESNQR